jgi:hypothetical protein
VRITLRVVDSIIAPVPGSAIVYLLDIGDTVINLLYVSLEIAVVLECLILSNDRLRVLIEPIGAGSEGCTTCHKKQRSAEKGFYIINVFHNSIYD